jgi:acetylornithine deacetylase/succinyl-diaminopimelate desuccinylase-like protein
MSRGIDDRSGRNGHGGRAMSSVSGQDMRAEARTIGEFVRRHESEIIAQLSEWIRIPSVSSVPEHAADVRRSAHWLAGRLREIGFPVAEVWDTGGQPAVFAEWRARPPSPVTVLVYSHHDVRAVHNDTWEQCRPFDPQARNGLVFGRGASDAKGQLISHLWGLRSHLAATGRETPAVNLKFLVEGEEETGSAHLGELLDRHGERVAADLIVYTDTMLWRADAPAVCLGVRGSVGARLTVRGPHRDVHRGVVAGAAPNPCGELCRLLGGLHDADGRVAVPGFYDDVDPVPDAERAAIAALPYTERDWLERTHSRAISGEPEYPVLERVWTRPSLEVLTLTGGDPTGAARGSIPSMAVADLSAEIVPSQSVEKVSERLRRWVAERISPLVDYELTFAPLSIGGYRTPEGHRAVEVLADCMTEAFGRPAGLMRNGGTGPAALLARKVAPVLFFGTGLPEDLWHDSDERADLEVLRRGAVTLALFWSRLVDVDL